MLKNFDWGIVLSIIFIFSLGLAVLYSVAPDLARHQLVYFGIGLILFFFFAGLDYSIFKNLSSICYLLSAVLLLSTFILGTVTRGALRWISLGPFTLQPSELVKPLFILAFAGWAGKKDLARFKNSLFLLFLFLPLAFLIFFQPALGSTLVVLAVWLAIVFAAGIRLSHLFLLFAGAGSVLPFFWRLLADYQKKRLLAFFHPGSDPLGSGYHLIQAKIAVGSGRIFGKGLGQGTQSHLRFLPEFQSDFIFAALAEELGLVGCLILIGVYFFLLWRILKIAQNAKDRFAFLIAIGVFSMLFFQIFVNIGMNIGLVPITGITLPLVSSGGSSLVATLTSLGLVESIARIEKRRI